MDAREEIEHLFSEKQVQRTLETGFHVRFVTLFGSIAIGRAKRNSDIDLAILFEKKPTRKGEEELMEYLRSLLKVDRLDVVCLNDAGCGLRYEVSQEGILLFENGQDAFLNFCIRTFKEFEEMNFLNRHYHEAQMEELRKFSDAQS